MTDYKNKYLKYKEKYMQLQKQVGGIHNGKTSITILNGLVCENKLKQFDVTFDNDVFCKLKQFFTSMKNNRDYLFIPKEFNDVNYIGKRTITPEDLNKMWYTLEKLPSRGATVKMLENNKFKIRVKGSPGTYGKFVFFDGKIVFKEGQVGKLKIELNGREEEINKQAENGNSNAIINDYVNIVSIYRSYMINTQDEVQMSNYGIGDNKLYLSDSVDWVEIKNRFDTMCDGSDPGNRTELELETDSRVTFITYTKYNILIKVGKDDGNYVQIIPVKKKGDKYEITSYTYKNLFVNEYYHNSVKKLFEVLVKKLNDKIVDGRTYSNIPDAFFHIHVVEILNENKIIMVLHAKYEIENKTNSDIFQYNFEDSDGKRYITERYKPIKDLSPDEIKHVKKIHSFYFLFDLDTNNHNLFSATDEAMNIRDSKGEDIWNDGIALKDNAFGSTIADINYIINRPIIVTIKSTTKILCEVFCP